MDCLFCKIIKGEIPCYKIYEDDKTFAFLDIAREGYGHTLVVPKKHSCCMVETDDEYMSAVMKTVKKITKYYIDNCGFSGANIIINNGADAGQSVMHLHVHIVPRKQGDGMGMWPIPISDAALEDMRKHLEIKEKKVVLYTDGACSGNPGIGGFSAILNCGGSEKIITGGENETTNNRMELMGVIKGLEALKEPCEVEIYSDSAYVVNAFLEDWITPWIMNGWKNSQKKPVLNDDLWKQLVDLTSKHKITWNKVKGHSDNEINNRCDELARGEIEKIKKSIAE